MGLESDGMDSTVVHTLTIVAIIGNGLLAGVFFAFSTFVMSGLRRAPAAAGIAAMQSINREAPTPAFMVLFGGATVVSVALGVVAIARWGSTAATLALVGGALAVVPFVMTGAYHQPRNLAFDDVDPAASNAPARWDTYASGWVRWNHVRTLASTVAATLLAVSLVVAG